MPLDIAQVRQGNMLQKRKTRTKIPIVTITADVVKFL